MPVTVQPTFGKIFKLLIQSNKHLGACYMQDTVLGAWGHSKEQNR